MEDIHTTKPSQHTTVGLVPSNDDIMLNCISFKSIYTFGFGSLNFVEQCAMGDGAMEKCATYCF